MGELTTLPISAIRENPVALRSVNAESEQFLGLVDSIKQKGFLGAITVRKKVDPETNKAYYELVDGLHRFAASKEAGLDRINVDVVNLDDDQTLEAQIMANIHKVETRPIEYAKQLRRIMARNPMMIASELATKLGKSSAWLSQRLGLNKIENVDIQNLIDSGKIALANAYVLAKLPAEEQAEFMDRAMTVDPKEFVPLVNKRAKEIREAARKGRDAADAVFAPVAYLQKLAAIKTEQVDGKVAKALCSGLKTAEEGFKRGVEWILHLDPQSVKAQEAKSQAQKQERKDAANRRATEKANKKAEIAAEKAKEAADAAAKVKEEMKK